MKSRSAPSKALSSMGAISRAAPSKLTLTDSTRSTRCLLAQDDEEDEEEVRKPMDLDEFIALGCSKFVCPYKIFVKKVYQRESLKHETSKHKKTTSQHPKGVPSDTEKTEETFSKETHFIDKDTLVISALYDSSKRLAELLLQELPDIPRVLMQIMCLVMPKYPALTKMTMKKCRINNYAMYELCKVLNFTAITDICLDGSSFPEGNYGGLLIQSRIQSLSLARCNINDDICETIASELHFLQPAETHLVTLNLSSNRITDEGAKHLGLALRTNRHLRYLNLSNNRITDEGADHILRVLMVFPLSTAEITAKRLRYITHLRAKSEIIKKYLMEASEIPSNTSKKMKQREGTRRDSRKHPFDDLTYLKAEHTACEQIGPFIDPFHNNFMKVIKGSTYCAGNMVLCYLNLGYNNISVISVKTLLELVKYQSMTKKLSQRGLMKVVIEGNNLPSSCPETDLLYDYLNRNVVSFSPKYKLNNDSKSGRTRARSRVGSIIPGSH